MTDISDKKLAESGDAPAQKNLGGMYDKGDGVEQDYEKAVYWYRKSAEQGYAKAQYNLGRMYYNGLGVEPDKQKAADWYRKSAEQGVADAQFNLGLMYAKGDGVPEDKEQAVYWLRQAAEQGDAQAQKNLDLMYPKAAKAKAKKAKAKAGDPQYIYKHSPVRTDLNIDKPVMKHNIDKPVMKHNALFDKISIDTEFYFYSSEPERILKDLNKRVLSLETTSTLYSSLEYRGNYYPDDESNSKS